MSPSLVETGLELDVAYELEDLMFTLPRHIRAREDDPQVPPPGILMDLALDEKLDLSIQLVHELRPW
jgi:hypothetical protein